MEDAIVDWKNEGEKAPEDYNSDVVSWVLKQGLSLGKMVLVTGIVISSAPVVLPPLVVISAFGIAISVPYGVFLASYACTEKLMAFLLPKAVPPSMEEYRALTYDEEEDGDEEKDMKKMQEEDEEVERTRNGREMRWGLVGEENEIEETPIGEIFEGKEEKQRGEIFEGKEEKQSGETSEMETKSIKEEDREKQLISEEPVLKNDENEEKKNEIGVIPVVFEEKKDQDKAKDIEIQDEPAKETSGLVEQTRGKGGLKESEKKAKGKKLDQPAKETSGLVEQTKDRGGLKESEKKAKGKKLDQDVNKGVEDKGIASDVVLDKDMGPKVNEIVQVIEQKTDENIENKTTPDKKSPRKAKNLPKKGSKETAQNGSGTSPGEEVYSEKKIWEEISALRTIVGYKAPRLPSSMEELKALYRFTGIQPPASVKNPSDLAEVTNKLRFLMAIVGVN